MMLTQATQLQTELLRIVYREIDRLKDQLAANVFEDVASFKYVMGQISAFRQMEDLIDEAIQKSDQRNR
jgi:hypothetical protein